MPWRCMLLGHKWDEPAHLEDLGLLDYRCKRRGCQGQRLDDDGTGWLARTWPGYGSLLSK